MHKENTPREVTRQLMGAGQFIIPGQTPKFGDTQKSKARARAEAEESAEETNKGVKNSAKSSVKSCPHHVAQGTGQESYLGPSSPAENSSTNEGGRKGAGQFAEPAELDPPQPPYPGERDERLKRPISKQTGPVTEEGKAAVSRNAFKHGGYATPSSGDASYASIEESIMLRLGPVGELQISIAKSISYEIWHIRNIQRTVVALEEDIDHEKVSVSQLASQLEFPFPDCYREAMLTYRSEESLRQRVHGHVCGMFSAMLDSAGHVPEGSSPQMAEPNTRAASLIQRAREVLSRPHLVQHLEVEFFEEFDAVMLDARLGRNSLYPVGPMQTHEGWMLPLVECWAYRNFSQIRVTSNRLMASLRMDLLTSPSIDRALKGASSRLSLSLSNYLVCRPDISSRSMQVLRNGATIGAL